MSSGSGATVMTEPLTITYNWLQAEDVGPALEFEKQGYPADEAANLEKLQYRQSNAGELFLGAYLEQPGNKALVGFICSTQSPAESLTHESLSEHIPSSASVCIHSVCVSPNQRRKRIALNMLKEYLSRLQAARKDGKPYERVLLITHENLRQLYENAGFEWVGKSSVVFGSQPWYEMRKNLVTPDATSAVTFDERFSASTESQKIPAGVWDALQRSSRNRPTGRQFSSYPDGSLGVMEPHSKRLGVSVNKFDLLCPRSDCGSIILKRGVGEWVERASVQLEPDGVPAQSILSALPTPPETCQWWLITPSPMAFENIGFTRPVQPTQTGPKLKLLACAECDLGPLGWSEEGGTEFWLACARVNYRG